MNKAINHRTIKCEFTDRQEFAVLTEEFLGYGRTIPEGTHWNGASIPSWAMSLVFLHPYHADLLIPSLVHDWDYTRKFDRKQADKLFYRLFMARGEGKCFRRRIAHRMQGIIIYLAVRIGGGSAWREA